jgi:hypothetical protein
MGSSKKVRGKPSLDKKPIAVCEVKAGWGTTYYDPETHECAHAQYCYIENVILNKQYWVDEYGYGCIEDYEDNLASSFDLPWDFESYKLTVYSDGTREYEVL